MSLLSERHLMTVVINMHKPHAYVMVMKVSCQWLWRCHVSLQV